MKLSTIPLLVFLFCSLSLVSTPVLAEDACGPLVQAKCLSCHFETRMCQKMRKRKGKSSWKRTIKAMVRHGAELDRGEQKTLIQCFTGRDSSILSLCGMDK